MSDTLESETAKVYLKPSSVPKHPGDGWTRFVCISDTHDECFDVPPGDVLLHAGDLSHYGRPETTIEWLKTLEHPLKIIIAGNHDVYLDERMHELGYVGREEVEEARAYIFGKDVKDAGIHYLEHQSFHFTTASGKQWKVYGSPVTRHFRVGSFRYFTHAEAEAIYDRIPSDTDILITHTPPYMILDRTKRDKNVGCEVLSKRLPQLNDCRLHVFGHIHEAHGARIVKDHTNERVSVNAALYSGHPAVTVDLRN